MMMTIVPDIPEASHPPVLHNVTAPAERQDTFARAVDGFGAALETAQKAEDAFANGSGSLIDAMYQRARADITLSVASAAANRVVQTVQSLLNMQV